MADIAKLGLFVALGYALLAAYARHRRPQWTAALARRRLASLALLTLAVSAVKVLEDVLAKESGPVDEALLWFIRAHVSAALGPLFQAITVSGSARVLLPLAVGVIGVLCWARRWFEAVLLGGSLLAANGVVYALKVGVGRARPDLWQTDWYWGSSFPSGHTLSVAAFSTAAVLCVGRMWPRWSTPSMVLAVLWTGAVALSRLVLGVHWPTDVLGAICLGASLPLLASLVMDLRSRTCAVGSAQPAWVRQHTDCVGAQAHIQACATTIDRTTSPWPETGPTLQGLDMTQPKLAPDATPPNTPLDPKRFPSNAQTEPTAGRDDVRQTAPPMRAPRQSQRPSERSGKGRSGGSGR